METVSFHRAKVYDPFLRLIHAWNGISILFLIVTVWLSDLFEPGIGGKTLWTLHIYLGYALVCGLFVRFVWGTVGPKHSRFSDMWHPAAWWRAMINLNLKSTPRIGHDELASGVYWLVYLLLLAMAVTGISLAAIEHSMGPLDGWIGDMPWLKEIFEEPHEVIYNLLMVFVVAHVAALIWHETKDKTPLAQAMVSGYQYQSTTEKGDSHA